MKNEIEKKSVLGGKVDVGDVGDSSKENDYSPKAVKKVLKENGLVASQTFKVKNPITGVVNEVTIERDGTTDSKVALALANPKLTKEFKEMMVANWLFERGKESASFIAELYRYKGAHTQETRIFKAQARQDVDSFGNIVVNLFYDIARTFRSDLGIKEFEVEDENEPGGKRKVLGARIDLTTEEVAVAIARCSSRLEQAAGMIAQTLKHNTSERERALGKNVFIDGTGKPYMVDDEGNVFYQEEKPEE